MKQCPRCKKKLPDEAAFCFVCGALKEEKPSFKIIPLPISPKATENQIQPSLENQAESSKVIKEQKPKKPKPTEEDGENNFKELHKDLGPRGYGWLKPEPEEKGIKKRVTEIGKTIKIILSPARKVIKKDWEKSKIRTIGIFIGIFLILVLLFNALFSNPLSRIKDFKKCQHPRVEKIIHNPNETDPEEKKREKINIELKRVKTYLNMGQYESAIKKSNEILKLDPNNLKAKDLIKRTKEIRKKIRDAHLLSSKGRYDDAIDILEKLREKNPENKAIIAAIEKVKEAKKAEKKKKGKINRDLKLVKSYLNMGQYESAIKKSNEILKLDPNNLKAKDLIKRAKEIREEIKVAHVFLDKGWYDDAIDILEKLREKNPGNEAIIAAIEKVKEAKKAEKEILGN